MTYLQKHYVCLAPQYSAFRKYVATKLKRDPSAQEWRYLCHILVNMLYKWDFSYIPIDYKTLKSALGEDFTWYPLFEAGLVNYKDYSKDEHKCRRFILVPDIVSLYLESASFDLDKPKKVNLFTGRLSKGKLKSSLYDSKRNPEPELIVNAIKCIQYCPFNRPAILKHLEQAKALADEAKKEQSPRAAYLYAVYKVDLSCFQAIDLDAIQMTDHLFSYKPAYSVGMSGRIYEKCGGLQSCTRLMKQAAFSDIPDVHNYDLVASQAYGMAQQFENLGLDTSWIFEYLNDKEAKYRYAKQIGVSVQCWKDCLYAVFFGAGVHPARPTGSIYDRLCVEFDVPEDELSEEYQDACAQVTHAYFLFAEVVKPVTTPLAKWHNWLVTEYLEYKIYYGDKKHAFINNPTGKTLNITEVKQEAKETKDSSLLKRRVAAFVLQGFEAAFIHHITQLSLEYDYKVLNNQHDGLLTEGAVPKEAIALAASLSNLKYSYLEEKELV